MQDFDCGRRASGCEDLENNLRRLGYAIAGRARSGIRAVQLAGQSRPDLVLMDIQLTGSMDGIAAAETIRSRFQIPVVFVTANTNDEVISRAKAAGPYGFLSKPFRSDELNGTIRIALHQHRVVQELFSEHNWLATLLDSLSDGVIATDAEGAVRYLNPIAGRLTGWTLAEAFGHPIETVYRLESMDGVLIAQCQLRKALASREAIPKARFLLRAKDGRIIPVEDAAAPIRQGGNLIGAATVFIDISDQIRKEEQADEERGRLEGQVQVTSEALGQTRFELRRLANHFMTVQEEERRRIARDLHDDVGQQMTVIGFEIDSLRQRAPADMMDALGRIQNRINEASDSIRTTSHRLHPSVLEDLGLVPALRALIREQKQSGMTITLRAEPGMEPISLDVATALYRIVQEALHNVEKHAPGTEVGIELAVKEHEIQLRVEDRGPGFSISEHGRTGLGLISMQERARLVGGSLLLNSRPGEGTAVVVRVPFRRDS